MFDSAVIKFDLSEMIL